MKKNKKVYIFSGYHLISGIIKSDISDKLGDITCCIHYFEIGDNFDNYRCMSEPKKIQYPSSISSYYENKVPVFEENVKFQSHSTLLGILNNKIMESEQNDEVYFFDCMLNQFDYDFINRRANDKRYKGYFNLLIETYNLLLSLHEQHIPIFHINDSSYSLTYKGEQNTYDFPLARNLIENKIRTKNYFLSNFTDEQVKNVVDSILEETLADNRINECIIQDTLIYISEDDYLGIEKKIEDELVESLKKFNEKYKKIICLFMVVHKKLKSIFTKIIQEKNELDMEYIDLEIICESICDYRRLNISCCNSVFKNTLEKKYEFIPVFEEYIKRHPYLTNKEKTDYRNRLKRIIDKLKGKKIYMTKEEFLS